MIALLSSMSNVSGLLFEPSRSPPQWLNSYPAAGTAVTVTIVPGGYDDEAGLRSTLPEIVPEEFHMLIVYITGALKLTPISSLSMSCKMKNKIKFRRI